MRCERCGGYLETEIDYVYDIEYFSCRMCGNVVFNNDDGLGLKMFKLPSRNKIYNRYCEECKKPFKASSPNKHKCDNCIGD